MNRVHKYFLATALVCLSGALVSAPAVAELTYESSFGSGGTGPGQFVQPAGVAVNDATGDVYVADEDGNRIEQFSADGTFIRMWGKGVNQTTSGNICPVDPGDVCTVGVPGGESGQFAGPRGIAVDNSNGPAAGSVYVQDVENNRVQRFTPVGQFVLMWGKGVNFDTGGDICALASGDGCQSGGVTKSGVSGQFSGWGNIKGNDLQELPGIATDGAGNVYVMDPNAAPSARVQKFDADGAFLGQVAGPNKEPRDRGLDTPMGLAVSDAGGVYVADGEFNKPIIKHFEPDQFTASGSTASWSFRFGANDSVIAIDPSNQFVFSKLRSRECGNSPSPTDSIIEYSPTGERVDCSHPSAPALEFGPFGSAAGMAVSKTHKLYSVNGQSREILVFDVPVAQPPAIPAQIVTEITSTKAVFKAQIVPNLDDTTYHLEYGTSPCSIATCTATGESDSIGASMLPQSVSAQIASLTPDTTYYYRFVAQNETGTSTGPDRSFSSYAIPVPDTSCPNNLARQQTAASLLLDCRAYELVSAEDTGGYNVESDLVEGQTPYPGFPDTAGSALYAVHSGVVPGAGDATNRGPDPYLAVRDEANQRWTTEYVGIPASAPSAEAFSSAPAGFDAGLTTFSFDGADICDPCFSDGSKGIPLRRSDGSLVQGMVGSLPVADPVSAGAVQQPLSADGTHFIFSSAQQFEPAGNASGTDVTIYDRDLISGTTEVASTLPDGSTIEAGQDLAQLDVSADGSRIVIGQLLRTDAAGNEYWHLYMHVGSSSDSIDLTPGVLPGTGALYGGMTSDGSSVFFTTADPLKDDSDASADLYRADVTGTIAELTRVSVGSEGAGGTDSCDPAGNSYNTVDWNVVPSGPTDCSVVSVGGGGGVAAESGDVYFLSPELLDGASKGIAGAPNLYFAASGAEPQFVATLESSASAPFPPVSNFRGTFGSFTNPNGVAIDSATGSTYVLDNLETEESAGAFVQKFDASGKVDAGFGQSGKITGSGTDPFLQYGSLNAPASIAVDNNPSSASYRDLYVPDMGRGVVNKYGPSGEYISQLSSTLVTGVAVNPTNGDVYTAGYFGEGFIFDDEGNQLGTFEVPAFEVHDLAVDSTGDVYVTGSGGETRLYDATGTFKETFDPSPAYGVEVDPQNDHVYIDYGDRVVELDPSGVPVGSPIGLGKISSSVGFAVDAGRLVVSNRGGGNVAEFGEPVTPASRSYDHPLVIDSVREAAVRHTADFQTNPSGDDATFTSTLPLTGFDSDERYEVFGYDAAGDSLQCVSCNPTGVAPVTDASLASNGLSLTDDGRVFFTSGEPLVLRDTGAKRDAYEWRKGEIELISNGRSSFDAGFLSVTADGTDAFFFTRESLTSNDQNGSLMKIYSAREEGGFFVVPRPPACAASDECHGPGTSAATPPPIGTVTGSGGNATAKRSCRRGTVKKRGRCVPKKKRKQQTRPKRSHRHD